MGFPIGRQPLRAGLHRPLPRNSVVNLKYTQINNYGNMFPMGGMYGGGYDYGCQGSSKGIGALGWIGLGTSLVGSILAGIFGKKSEEVDETGGGGNPDAKGAGEPENNQPAVNPDIKALTEENSKLKDRLSELEKIVKASQERENPSVRNGDDDDDDTVNNDDTINNNNNNDDVDGNGNGNGNTPARKAGAEHVAGTTFTYNVRGKKLSATQGQGDTGYNIVAGLYTTAEGKPLTSAEVKAICKELFKGNALKTGALELPRTVTVNGKEYSVSEDKTKSDEAMYKSVGAEVTFNFNNNLKIHKSGATKVGDHWVATVDGKRLEGQYATEKEALEAAKKQIDSEAKKPKE